MPQATLNRNLRRACPVAASLLAILLLLPGLTTKARAAIPSADMQSVLAKADATTPVPAILYLGNRVTMDELYTVAKSLPMHERRAYVVRTLKARFAEISSQLMPQLDAAVKSGEVTHVRPLWVLNAVRITANARFYNTLDAVAFPEVEFMDSDRPHANTLDQIGWGVHAIQADRAWNLFGADGRGVIVGHIDAGAQVTHPGLVGHFWMNPGEDLNGNGTLDAGDLNQTDDDGNGYVDDFHGWDFDYDINDLSDDPIGGGHGTKTGSIISSSPMEGCDTLAVAPGAKLMELSAFILQGAFFEASQYAIAMGANVISASVSFKQLDCDDGDEFDCPNYVAHRRVAEIELAAGLIHANSTGNEMVHPIPLALPAPSNCPPPMLTPMHPLHGGVSSIVAVSSHNSADFYANGGIGPAAWSQQDICIHPRMPFCGPAGSGNEYPEEYNDYPYQNGTSPGLMKPDVIAPGDFVPMLYPGGTCTLGRGTSFATPHVGGALALIISAFPGIPPEETYRLLVSTAQDLGPAGFDDRYGFGKPQLFRACSSAAGQRGPLHGAVISNGQPLPGVRIQADTANVVTSSANGLYLLSLSPGTYTVRYEKYGWTPVELQVTIDAGSSTLRDVVMNPAVTGTVSGVVTANGNPLNEAPIRIPEIPLETVTNANGSFLMELYEGRYTLLLGELPWETESVEVVVGSGSQAVNVDLGYSPRARRTGPDDYGYYIYDNYDADTVTFDWVEINPTQGSLDGEELPVGDEGITSRNLSFTFRYYGQDYNTISIGANGLIILGYSGFTGWDIAPIPSSLAPNGYLAVFRSDWIPPSGSVWFYDDLANGRAIVEWYDVPNFFGSTRVTFQAILYDPQIYTTPSGDSPIKYQYQSVLRPFEATVGIENPAGDNGLQYAYQLQYEEHAAPLASGRALLITTDSTHYIADVEPVARPTLPATFALAQNYPNPFNPTTTFSWTVARAANVRLALYDLLGREVALVFEGRQAPGEYRSDFNGTNLATGIYFARLEVDRNPLAVRKVMLLK